ncbi:hypothetical protein EGN72_02595 [Pseudorhodobacter sp. E13]|uniref:hypothetical protein n=1 Tax=Pseudorhodobacter sp. E13 TaxID=2487931 RepID=UPI000F8EDC7C|nr:hypothetical protein [Pseudorhodobacter sp. E13]RUS64900.1 hypothetical protein EGN72_02595 [Pseudorhodobacter sp. E13]
MTQTTPLTTARAAWGDAIPDWVEALAIECGRSSQNAVAKELERSSALISQVLRNKYPGNLTAFEERFRGVFLDARVRCPALGDLPANECQDWREKAREFVPTNSQRSRMFAACKACPRNQKGGEE